MQITLSKLARKRQSARQEKSKKYIYKKKGEWNSSEVCAREMQDKLAGKWRGQVQ